MTATTNMMQVLLLLLLFACLIIHLFFSFSFSSFFRVSFIIVCNDVAVFLFDLAMNVMLLFLYILYQCLFLRNLILRLNVSTISWDDHRPSILELRGVFANGTIKVKQQARKEGSLKNMISNKMVGFASSDDRVSTASLFSSVDSYMSYYLIPEAADLSELKGFKGAYTESINPAAYIELFKLLKLSLSNKYQRPLKGMSAIINTLVVSVRNYGGKLYAESEVVVIEKDETKFILRTMNLTVFTNKIAIATHPVAYMKVKGGVSEEIHRDPVFQSIKIKPRLHDGCDGDAIFLKLSRRQRAAKIASVATL